MSGPLVLSSTDVVTTLSNCDREPIRIPSRIQPHGMLIAARESDMRIVYVSENSTEMLGISPVALFERTLTDVLGADAVESMRSSLGAEQYFPPNIQTLTFPCKADVSFDAMSHRSGGLLCVELEPSKGNRSWEVLSSRLQNSLRELRYHSTLEGLCAVVPGVIEQLTGYDRVMVYQFDRDGHGEIVAEKKIPEMEPFLHLHYPASDIPSQARELYLIQRIRTIVDVGYQPVRVLGHPEYALGEPLDMTYCGLRSISPIHVEYLQNMGVGGSFGISLVHKDQLWGMILCHHRTPKLIPPEMRILCDFLGQLVSMLISLNLQARESSDRLDKIALLDNLSASISKTSVDAALSEPEILLPLVEADGAFVRIGELSRLVGRTPELSDATALMASCQAHLSGNTLSSDETGKLFPDFAHLASTASGILYIPLKEPTDGILWFRSEVTQSVRWAGKPDASKVWSDDGLRMSPRKSFASWEEIQRGHSLPWSTSQIEAALHLERITLKALLERADARLLRLSYSDPLTRLPNRRALVERLAAWQSRGVKGSACILFLDIDDFRSVNDELGHVAGDEFLKQMGDRLSALEGGKHFAARLGGDEFVIFCDNMDLAAAEHLGITVLRSAVEPFLIAGTFIRTTVSIGIAPVHPDVDELLGKNFSDPLRAADSAMYVAKHKGGNQVSIVESREQAEVLRQRIVQDDIEKGLAAEELATAYGHMREVMDSTSQGIIQINHDWKVVYGNRKAVESRVDFEVGQEFWKHFPVIASTLVEQQLREAMQSRIETSYETYDAAHKQWYKVQAFPTRDGLSLFFSDISADKNMQDQLVLEQMLREKRIEALSHMAGGLAHEINNPLAIIFGRASSLLSQLEGDAPPTPVDIRKACDSIINTSDRAMRILRGLRGFARGLWCKYPRESSTVVFQEAEDRLWVRWGGWKSCLRGGTLTAR